MVEALHLVMASALLAWLSPFVAFIIFNPATLFLVLAYLLDQ